MNNKIIEYRKTHPRCRYCKYAHQDRYSTWTCLAKQQSHFGQVSDTKFKGVFCQLFEVKEN